MIEEPWAIRARRTLTALQHFLRIPDIRETGEPYTPGILAELQDALCDVLEQPRYRIDPDADAVGGQTITCGSCALTSFHSEDVKHRYCGICHVSHALGG